LAVITLLILALVMAQPVAAQSFKPDLKAGFAAYIKSDFATVLKHFRPLAEQGHADGQFWLGHMYGKGYGVTKDYAEALRWYRKAAEQGDAAGQSMVGLMYQNGQGVAKDYVEAVKWYSKAAKQGHKLAQYSLASLEKQLRAEGNWPPKPRQAKAKPAFTPDLMAGWMAYLKKDYATALRHYRPLAEQGHARAQIRLGFMYHFGEGVTKDPKEAVRWIRKAAKQGDALAKTNLASLEKQLRAEDNRPPRPRQASKPPSSIGTAPSASKQQKELERLRRENARLKKVMQAKPKKVAKRSPPKKSPLPKSATSGSGFFVSKLGHVITNQHVVNKCRKVTVGDNANKQVTANVLETDRRNDLALLKISSMQMASAETKTLVAKLGLTVTPLASQGLLRSDSVELGEDVVVAGFPFGDIFSNTIKITKGVVSAKRGLGNDSGQFQIDAAVQKGSSGGPIYDENGNIIGVVVSQLNKLKVAKAIGSLPELVNFGIKASTVKQFLNSSGLPSSWSKRTKRMTTKAIAKIAENQTVMVMCHR
jgi:TPR repeat protein